MQCIDRSWRDFCKAQHMFWNLWNDMRNARKVVFVGTFTASGLQVAIADGCLSIEREGQSRKFLKHVEHVTFSGNYAKERGQEVLYITERCVFALTKEGMELIEIAPGIDIDKDILAQMDFRPIVRNTLRLMDERIFRDAAMGLSLKNARLWLATPWFNNFNEQCGWPFWSKFRFSLINVDDFCFRCTGSRQNCTEDFTSRSWSVFRVSKEEVYSMQTQDECTVHSSFKSFNHVISQSVGPFNWSN